MRKNEFQSDRQEFIRDTYQFINDTSKLATLNKKFSITREQAIIVITLTLHRLREKQQEEFSITNNLDSSWDIIKRILRTPSLLDFSSNIFKPWRYLD